MVRHAGAAALAGLLIAGWTFPESNVVEGARRSSQAADAQEKETQPKGLEAVGQACSQCHTLRPVTLQRKGDAGWRDTVFGMIGRGAQVRPDEIEPMIAYLVANFGPTQQAPASTAPAGSAANRPESSTRTSGPLPEGDGRDVFIRRCVTCHAAESVTNTRQTRAQWVETIRKMRALGAVLSAEEEAVVTAYLAEHVGPQSR